MSKRNTREKIVQEKSINKVNYDLLIKIHPIDSIGKERRLFFFLKSFHREFNSIKINIKSMLQLYFLKVVKKRLVTYIIFQCIKY